MLQAATIVVLSLLFTTECGWSFTVVRPPSVRQSALSDRNLLHNTAADDNEASASVLTDWVVENLETANSSITKASEIQAGENDTLPADGLRIANFKILPAGASPADDDDDDSFVWPIRLLLGRNGWGTGVHPTTRLCLEWMADTGVMEAANVNGDDGVTVLDYGCGSGILSIAALHLGAARCIGVDIEAEALVTATRNVQLNGFSDQACWQAFHTREIVPYSVDPPADIVVANILIGQLVRPSMVAALVSNLRPDGYLCLSGIRPGDQVTALQAAYARDVEWIDPISLEPHYQAELAAVDCPGSVESYGFDCGAWACIVGRKKSSSNREQDILDMSELAVQ